MIPSNISAFAQGYAKAWSTHRPERVAAFFASNGSLKVNDGAPAVGRTAIAEVAQSFMTAFPDMTVTFDRLERKAERIHFHWTLAGTNAGPGGTGKFVRVSGYEDWRFAADSLVAESLGHFDAAEYDRQLQHGAP